MQAKDEYNATTEQTFTVYLSDIYEPSLPNHVVDLNSERVAAWNDPDLSKLPVACAGKHAESVSEHIKMKRRNTIQRDAMHASIKDEHLEHHVHA